MNHRRMSRAQKAAITDTFLQPYSVRVQLQTKAEDSSLILSSQKAKESGKAESNVTPNSAPALLPLHRTNLFARKRPAFPRFSRDFPQPQ